MFGPPDSPSDHPLVFEWDSAKNDLNIRRHGLDFADAGETTAQTRLDA